MSLEFATRHADGLNERWMATVSKPEFQYFYGVFGYYNLKAPKIEDDTWNHLQMVSIDQGRVLGFMSASIQRAGNYVSDLIAINFEGRASAIFARDFKAFFKSLFAMGFHSVRWTVAVGNPAEKIYDRVIRRCGGRIVGCEREYFLLPNGSRLDCKRYEILVREANV